MTWDEGIVIAGRVLVALPFVALIGLGAGALLAWLVGPEKE